MTRHRRHALPRRFPSLAGLTCLLALLCAASGCAGGALSGQLTVTPPRDAAALSRARDLARRAQSTRDPDKAIDLYRRALASYPDLPAGWNNLGVVLLKQQRYLEAAEAFVQASERSPSDPRPYYNLGLAWEEAGYLRDALRHYERALARDPRYLPALKGAIRAERLLGQGREITLDWIRTALAMVADEEWRIWLALQKRKVEELVYPSQGRPSQSAPPPDAMYPPPPSPPKPAPEHGPDANPPA